MSKNVKTFTNDGYQLNGQLPSGTCVNVEPSGTEAIEFLSHEMPGERFKIRKGNDWMWSFVSSGDLSTALDYPVNFEPRTKLMHAPKMDPIYNFPMYDYSDEDVDWAEQNCTSPDAFDSFGPHHPKTDLITMERRLSQHYARLWWVSSAYRCALRATHKKEGKDGLNTSVKNNLGYHGYAVSFIDGVMRVIDLNDRACYYTVDISAKDLAKYKSGVHSITPAIDSMHNELLALSVGTHGRSLPPRPGQTPIQMLRRCIAANSRVRVNTNPSHYFRASDKKLEVYEQPEKCMMQLVGKNIQVVHQ